MDTSVSKISENDKNTINALEKSSLKIDKLYNLLNETEAKIQQFDQASIKLTNISKTLNYLYRMTTIINNFINDDTNKTTTLKKLDEKVDLVYIIDSVNKFLQQKDVENAILEFSKLDFYKSHSVNYDKKHNLEIENLKINIIEMLKYSTRQAFYVEDAKIVKNLLKFYPILGLNSFGIEKFSVFICLEISEKCENLEKILEKFDISDINKMAKDDKKLLFSDSISMMFEFVAESIEENQQYIENYYGNGYLNFFIQKFEKEVSYYMRKYLKLMDDYYAVKELVTSHQTINITFESKSKCLIYITEVSRIIGRSEHYFDYIKNKLIEDNKLEENHNVKPNSMTTNVQSSDREIESNLMIYLHHLIGYYIQVEAIYIKNIIYQCILMDHHNENELISTLVDDVFYNIKNSMKRIILTKNTNIICAMVNNLISILLDEKSLIYTFDLYVRNCFGDENGMIDVDKEVSIEEKDMLCTIQSEIQNLSKYTHLRDNIEANDEKSNILTIRSIFLIFLNNMDVAKQNIDSLAKFISKTYNESVISENDYTNKKLECCILSLTNVKEEIDIFIRRIYKKLYDSFICPIFSNFFIPFSTIDHSIESTDYKLHSCWLERLVDKIEEIFFSFKQVLTPRNGNIFLINLIAALSNHLSKIIYNKKFSKSMSSIVHTNVRTLMQYFDSLTDMSIKKHYLNLKNLVTILSLENIRSTNAEFIEDVIYDGVYTASEIKQILLLRVDISENELYTFMEKFK